MGHYGFICHGQARLLITRLPKITLPLTMPKSILTLRAKPKTHAFMWHIYPADQSSSIQNIYHSWSTSRYLHGDSIHFLVTTARRGCWHWGWWHTHLSWIPSPCLFRCLLRSLGNVCFKILFRKCVIYLVHVCFKLQVSDAYIYYLRTQEHLHNRAGGQIWMGVK
jgi:hypothetical protein